jgi:hypothetical protein
VDVSADYHVYGLERRHGKLRFYFDGRLAWKVAPSEPAFVNMPLHVVLTLEGRAAARRHDGLRNRWCLDPLYGRGYPADIWALRGADAPPIAGGDLATIAAATHCLDINYYYPETITHALADGPLKARVLHVDFTTQQRRLKHSGTW